MKPRIILYSGTHKDLTDVLLFKCARDYVEQFARDWSFERPHGGNDDGDCQMQGTEKEISRRDFGIIYSQSTLEDYVQKLSRLISGKTTFKTVSEDFLPESPS